MRAAIESALSARAWAQRGKISSQARARGSLLRALAPPFGVALALRLLMVLVLDAEPSWDGVVYVRAAEQLAAGEGYTLRSLDPDSAPWPTAFYPVGYPAALALVRKLGGGLGADRVVHAICCALLVPLALVLARRAAGARAARLAAILTACWPGAIVSSATWLAEPLFALACGVALLPALYARRAELPRALIATGLLFGLAAYVRPTALSIAVLAGTAAMYARAPRTSAARAIRQAGFGLAITLGAACLVLAPWCMRNAEQLGAPVWVSTNGGVNLLIGALEEGGFERLPEPQPCRADGLTEVQRDRCFTRKALEVIASDPLAWAGRGLLKLAHTFGHESAVAQAVIDGTGGHADRAASLWLLGACRVGWLALLPFMVVGGLVLGLRAFHKGRKGRDRAALLVLAPVAAVALVHAVFLGGDRYHGALVPMLGALAGIGASALARLLRASALR